MKTTIITIASAIMLIVSTSSTVHANPIKNLNTVKIVEHYVHAIVAGTPDLNDYLFAKDFEYQNTANNSKHNKKEYTKFLKNQKGLKFNCKTSYEILDETGNSSVAKATMQFDHFSRVDYITLRRTEDGWQVSKVVTTYP